VSAERTHDRSAALEVTLLDLEHADAVEADARLWILEIEVDGDALLG
jgi:hypothetical protein